MKVSAGWSALRRPGAGLVAVLLLLAAVLAVADRTGGSGGASDRAAAAPAPLREVTVARVAATCPAPVTDRASVTRVSVAAPGVPAAVPRDDPGQGGLGPGRVTLSATGARATVLAGLEEPGSAAVEPEPLPAPEQGSAPAPWPLVARGSGPLAPGLAASQLTRSTDATMRGLAGTTCTASGTDFWFVGSGAAVGQRGRVYLTNPEPAPAVVDVLLYGPDGPIAAPDARGVTVAGGEQEVRLLDALAPGTTRFAIHVRARQGRVAAAVRDLQIDGLTPLGADWVPAAAAPARRVVVPGVPGGTGERRLQVLAPGEADAVVRVRLVSVSGVSAPAGLDVIEVRAGSVADVDMAPFTGGEPVSVQLESDVPVTAGVLARVTGAAGQLGELAYAAAALPLRPETPGVVPEVRQGVGVTSRLLLTAPGEAATVELSALAPATGIPVAVRVPAGTQVSVDLGTLSSAGSFAVTVVPLAGSGPVLAVRQVDEAEARGPFVTSSPVEPGRYVVPVPRVVADLSTGLR